MGQATDRFALLDALRERAVAFDVNAGEADAAMAELELMRNAVTALPMGPGAAGVLSILDARRATALRAKGALRDAFEAAMAAEHEADTAGDADGRVLAALTMAQVLYDIGHLDEARRRVDAVLELRGVDPRLAARAHMNTAAILRAMGRLEDAATAFDALDAWRGKLSAEIWAAFRINAASCWHQVGRLDDARAALAEARAALTGVRRRDLTLWIDAIDAWVAARADEPERALQLTMAVLEAPVTAEVAIQSSAVRALAEAAIRAPDRFTDAQVLDPLRAVLARAIDAGARQEVVDLHGTLSAVSESRGDLVGAVRHLREERRASQSLAEARAQLQHDQVQLRAELARLQIEADALRTHRAALERANRALAETEAARERILATLAHDLRNPLSSLTILVDQLDVDDPELMAQRRALLSATVDRMTQILAQVTAAQGSESPPAVDVGALVHDSVAAFQGLAARKEQRIAFAADPDARAAVDPEPVRRITDNLLSNALKFSPRAREVAVAVRAGPGSVAIEIADQGPGFPGLDPSHGLVYGATLGTRPTAGESSTGIGLHAVYQLAAQLGGTVALGNRAEGGAVVRVTLPGVTGR